jgi:hypothetical protein
VEGFLLSTEHVRFNAKPHRQIHFFLMATGMPPGLSPWTHVDPADRQLGIDLACLWSIV